MMATRSRPAAWGIPFNPLTIAGLGRLHERKSKAWVSEIAFVRNAIMPDYPKQNTTKQMAPPATASPETGTTRFTSLCYD
jgi:hypothetical protein